MTNLHIALLLSGMAAALYVLYRNDYRRAQGGRSNIFNDCTSLLAEPWQIHHALNYPRLSGSYQGYQVVIEAQVDTLSMRKVPPLWLTVSIIGKRPSSGSLDVLVRPQNTEFYSPAWQWDETMAIPPTWPQHAIIKHQGTLPAMEVLETAVPALFTDEKVKELLITPTQVRITYLAKQAERGEYMLMRNAVFDDTPVAAVLVAGLLQSAAGIRQKLEGVTSE